MTAARPTSRLRAWRERLGMTQADLARRAKVKPFYVAAAEASVEPLVAALKAIYQEHRAARQSAEREAEVERAWSEADKSAAAALAKEAMLAVAWELLDRGDAERADRLLDVLPRAEAIQLLDEFFAEPIATEPAGSRELRASDELMEG